MNNFLKFTREILYKFEAFLRGKEREFEKENCDCEGILFSFHVIKFV